MPTRSNDRHQTWLRLAALLLGLCVLTSEWNRPVSAADKKSLIFVKDKNGRTTSLLQKVVVTSGKATLASSPKEPGEPIEPWAIFFRIKNEDGSTKAVDGRVRVGNSEGRALGWLGEKDVSEWDTRFVLEPIDPQKERAFELNVTGGGTARQNATPEGKRLRTPRLDGGWDEHDLRSIWLCGARRKIERLRREQIGFALQSGELLPALTVRENIATPLRLNGVTGAVCQARVDELLKSFGLDGQSQSNGAGRRLDHSRINKLSGGEYQRVALARAIVHRPTLLYVDEPTSALNRELAWGALQQVRALQCGPTSRGAAVMITHDEQLAAAFADTIVRMAPIPGRPAGEVVEIVANVPSAANGHPNEQRTEAVV